MNILITHQDEKFSNLVPLAFVSIDKLEDFLITHDYYGELYLFILIPNLDLQFNVKNCDYEFSYLNEEKSLNKRIRRAIRKLTKKYEKLVG